MCLWLMPKNYEIIDSPEYLKAEKTGWGGTRVPYFPDTDS